MPTKRTPKQVQERRKWFAAITRDLVILAVGLVLIIYEAVLRHEPPRESLILLYGGMIGLPAILRADKIRRNGNGE